MQQAGGVMGRTKGGWGVGRGHRSEDEADRLSGSRQLRNFTEKTLFECFTGFPGDSDGKESASNAEDPGSVPESGRSPGEGNGNPLQYSYLENSMDRRAWWATVHGSRKELDMTEQLTLSLSSLLGEFSVFRHITSHSIASPFWKMEFFFLEKSSRFDRFIPMGLLCSPFEKKPLLGYTEQSYIL